MEEFLQKASTLGKKIPLKLEFSTRRNTGEKKMKNHTLHEGSWKTLKTFAELPVHPPLQSHQQPKEQGAQPESPSCQSMRKADRAMGFQQNDADSLFILLMRHFLLIKFSIGKILTSCYFPQTKS